ncbi:dihydropteroate synthase [Desulfoferrobacter suflitae]|uniref:dihydropteroate synthase n=1 Tax=Desulfoferrobacter suflitae TaxID=2865782 RepID=UPI0021641545|nr:dihydropteroate synthase [Desulfoferrobacter suflitae]MCK8602159.1 dihydropteroate synthase [Desulfoferrobacter suflitae]
MAFMVEATQEATSMGMILDSPHARILARGLELCSKPPVLNGLTLEDHRIAEILPLAVQHKTQLIVLLLDENSVSPAGMEEKLALAIQLRQIALEAGMEPDDLIFDPLLPNLSWHDAHLRVSEAVKTVRMLASGAIFQEPVRTIIGLSNLRSGLKKYYSSHLEQVCLAMFAGAELEWVLADALDDELVQTWRLINQISRSRGS